MTFIPREARESNSVPPTSAPSLDNNIFTLTCLATSTRRTSRPQPVIRKSSSWRHTRQHNHTCLIGAHIPRDAAPTLISAGMLMHLHPRPD